MAACSGSERHALSRFRRASSNASNRSASRTALRRRAIGPLAARRPLFNDRSSETCSCEASECSTDTSVAVSMSGRIMWGPCPAPADASNLKRNQASRLLVRGEIGALQARDTLQLNGCLAAIDTDVGVATARRDVVVRLQVGQRMSLDIQLIARYEVLNNVRATVIGFQELEEI